MCLSLAGWRIHSHSSLTSDLLTFIAEQTMSSPSIPSTSSSFPVSYVPPTTIQQLIAAPANGASSAALVTPPELEQTLSMLSSHRTVLGYLLLSRSTPVKIIRHSGVVFEGDQGRRYAGAVSKIVEAVRSGLENVGADGSETVSEPCFAFLESI